MITLRVPRPTTDHRWLWTLVSLVSRFLLLLIAALVWTAIGIRVLGRYLGSIMPALAGPTSLTTAHLADTGSARCAGPDTANSPEESLS